MQKLHYILVFVDQPQNCNVFFLTLVNLLLYLEHVVFEDFIDFQLQLREKDGTDVVLLGPEPNRVHELLNGFLLLSQLTELLHKKRVHELTNTLRWLLQLLQCQVVFLLLLPDLINLNSGLL